MKSYQVKLYVERGDQEIELLVQGHVYKFVRAIVHLPAEYCRDSEGGNSEITATLYRGEPWQGELTDSEVEEADQLLFEAYQDDDDFGPEEREESCLED